MQPPDRSKKTILILVLSIHLSLILWATLFHAPFQISTAPKHIRVKTHAPTIAQKNTSQPAAARNETKKAASLPKPPMPTAAKPKPLTPAPKKDPLKEKRVPITEKKAPSIAKKSESVKPLPKPKKSPPDFEPLPDNLLQELEESIAKIEGKRDNLYAKEKPLSRAPLQIDAFNPREVSANEGEETEYQQSLVQCLHQSLNLPEFGEVKIQLTLSQSGTVEKVVVMKAESEKNKKYLEMHLP